MKQIGVVMVIAAAACWASVGIFVRILTSFHFTAIQITTVRSIAGLAAVFAFLFIKDKRLFSINLKDLPWFDANGILSILFFNLCYARTIQLSSIATAAVLLYTAPIFVMIFSILFFKEKFSVRKGICLILVFCGCALVSGMGNAAVSMNESVLVTGLLAGLGYSFYSIFSRILIKKYSPLTIVFYTFLCTSMVSCIISRPLDLYSRIIEVPISAAIGILAGIITSAIPYILYTSSLKYIEASKAAMIASVEPVIAAVFGLLLYREIMTLFQMIGVLCIVVTIILLEQGERKIRLADS